LAWIGREGLGDGAKQKIVSYDEKPGIPAIGTTAPDLAPEPGLNATFARDHEEAQANVDMMLRLDNAASLPTCPRQQQQKQQGLIEGISTDPLRGSKPC
jgi:hypothetical protein